MRRGIVAAVASCALLYGCATPWPQVVAKSDPAFAHRAQPIQKIDLLPIDLQLWVDDPDKRGAPAELRQAAEQELATAVLAGLHQKGYVDNAEIGWDGNYAAADGHPAPALDHDAVAATVESLSSYGTAASRADRLPVPYLPAHLGDATGGDATLYVGGWSFVGDNDADAGEIATYVVIGVVIVAAIVIIAIAASKSKGGDGGHTVDHRAGGGGGGGGAIAVSHVGHFGSGHTVDHRGLPPMRAHHGGDAFGHSDTTLLYVDDRPDFYDDDGAPHDGHSQMYVEMTLVDNHTGLVLWHARQQFPASAARPAEIDRVVASLLATLPAAP
jgi:hypothetical protein